MEAFNVIPLFVGPLYQKALLHFSGDAAAYQAWKERLQDFQVKEEDHSPEHSCRHTGSSALCRLGLAGAGLLIMLFSRRKSGDRD